MLAPCTKLCRATLSVRYIATRSHDGIPHGKIVATRRRQAITLSPEYLNACTQQPSQLTQKLLLIELERLLVFPEFYTLAKSFKFIPHLPRPYLSVFRNYLIHPATSAWLHVVICTTAPRRTALRMVSEGTPLALADFAALYTPKDMYPGGIVGVSTRVAPKNLEVVWDTFKPRPSAVPPPRRHWPATTVLVDRLERSGAQQPHNLVLFPEYDKPLRRHDLDLLHAQIGTQFSKKELQAAANRLRERPRTLKRLKGYARFVYQQTAPGAYDDALIALIGILHHLKSVHNVAAWLRGGGLTGVEDAERAPPSAAEGSTPWFDDRQLFEMWRARGYAAVAELGIPVEPGIINDQEHVVKIARDALDTREVDYPAPEPWQGPKRHQWGSRRNTTKKYSAKRARKSNEEIAILKTVAKRL
ncbi:hypothetical protein FB451DRAFT_1385186 [Mycena latifolia]|nr:hypothetical protein FB451DRAFT_1385186 [Mycena latifolia]